MLALGVHAKYSPAGKLLHLVLEKALVVDILLGVDGAVVIRGPYQGCFALLGKDRYLKEGSQMLIC